MPAEKRPNKYAHEAFYLDDLHVRQDREIHEPILADGDDAAALKVGKAVMRRLGLSPESIKRLVGEK